METFSYDHLIFSSRNESFEKLQRYSYFAIDFIPKIHVLSYSSKYLGKINKQKTRKYHLKSLVQ